MSIKAPHFINAKPVLWLAAHIGVVTFCAYKMKSVGILVAGIAAGIFVCFFAKHLPIPYSPTDEGESRWEESTQFSDDYIESSVDPERDDEAYWSQRSCSSPGLEYDSD